MYQTQSHLARHEGQLPQAATASAGPVGRCAHALAFTSGKGGVGKSNIAAATAMLLAQCGKRVLLVDGDLGLANIDVLLGMKPRLTLQHVIRGERSIEEVLVEGPGGISILPAGSGLQQVATLGETQLEELVAAFQVLDSRMDYFVFDTPAGISFTVTAFLDPSDQVVLVTMPEPTAVTDAYALIKVLWRRGRRDGIGVLVNQASETEGRSIWRGLSWVSEQFLDQQLEFVGHVPCDPLVGDAVRRQQPIALAYPEAPFVSALRVIALKWLNSQAPPASGGVEAFVRDAAALIGDDGDPS
jgi:flagellar biosynthesis protein FlhG